MSNFRRKYFGVLILSVAVFNFATNSAVASAGYLPVNFGETLNVTTCIPETGRSAKPPLILNIQGLKTNYKNVEVARVTKWGKKKGNCGKWEYEVTIPWKVKVTGSYTLVITAPNSQVDPATVWPDGVDIPDAVTNTKKSNGNTSVGKPLSDAQIIAIMTKCVKKNIKRANAGENLLDTSYLDTTMAILSDCIEAENSTLVCSQNNSGITVCGIRGKRTGFSLGAVIANVITG
jgi:hypothetical protein